MAVTHIKFNDQTNLGRRIRRALQQLEEGREELRDVISSMATMIDGDGSEATHFGYATTEGDFVSDAVTKAAFEELNSLYSKMNSDNSVSFVDAALTQAFNKFR